MLHSLIFWIVSWTLSCSLSSTAVAPTSIRFASIRSYAWLSSFYRSLRLQAALSNWTFHSRYYWGEIYRLASISVLSPSLLKSSISCWVYLRYGVPGLNSLPTRLSAPFVYRLIVPLSSCITTDIRLRSDENSRFAKIWYLWILSSALL